MEEVHNDSDSERDIFEECSGEDNCLEGCSSWCRQVPVAGPAWQTASTGTSIGTACDRENFVPYEEEEDDCEDERPSVAAANFCKALPKGMKRKYVWLDSETTPEQHNFEGVGGPTSDARVNDAESPIEYFETPYFRRIMSRNRFQNISTFLHFNDNAKRSVNNDDRLFKLRPVYDYIRKRWQTLYNLNEHISIDEGMLKWRGRLYFKVYNKSKPIKSYILADSRSKYCFSLETYCGKSKSLKETVLGLLSPHCLYKWHSLYMDNLYNSVELAEDLLKLKVLVTGTLRKNRGEPGDIRNLQSELEPHSTMSRDNGRVFVLAWKDKRVVTAISTKHNATTSEVHRRAKGKGDEGEKVVKPVLIQDYNKYMSGVDGLHQMISYYPCTCKTLKWPKKFFYYMMGISVVNAYVIYLHQSQKKMPLYNFLLLLCEQLCNTPNRPCSVDNNSQPHTSNDAVTSNLQVDSFTVQNYNSQPNPSDNSQLDDCTSHPQLIKSPLKDPWTRLRGGFASHTMALYPATGANKSVRRECRVCFRKDRKRKQIRFLCKECNIPLCAIGCFKSYHTKQDYTQ